ncbi:MAG: hypothetical protein SynsKO_00890 [Synoicihabitans sp.]
MQGLGDLAGGSFGSTANAVSADGATVWGNGTTVNFDEAFQWTSGGGMQLLDQVGGTPMNFARSVSSDGSFVAGNAGGIAVRSESGGGQFLGTMTGGSYSNGQAISSDGSTIVGDGNSAAGIQSFRWTSAGGMEALGLGTDGVGFGGALGVNADGTVVVGFYYDSVGGHAYRWTAETGIVSLGDLAGGSVGSSASAVSADGSFVVGTGASDAGIEAMFWTEATGMVSLYDFVSGQGVDLTGWSGFNSATAISGDGDSIVGSGVYLGNTQAFILSGVSGLSAVPEPGSFALFAGLAGLLLSGTRRRRRCA